MFDMRKYSSHLGKMLNSDQRGVILIWLIFILVAAGILGSSMVYLTTSSTYDELLANNQARTYYLAESGARYAISQFTQDPDIDTTTLDGIYSLSNGNDQFTLSVSPDDPADPVFLRIESKGTISGESWFEGNRMVTYKLIKPINESFGDITNWNITTDFGDIYDEEKCDGEDCLRVKDLDSNDQIHMPLNWENLDIDLAEVRMLSGDFLSYELQVKMLIDIDGAGVSRAKYYMMGLSFRLDTANENSYGISFFKSRDPENSSPPPNPPAWAGNFFQGADWKIIMQAPNDEKLFIILWEKTPSGGIRLLDYEPLTEVVEGVVTDKYGVVDLVGSTDNDGDGDIDEDPVGDANGDGCPGVCGEDDDEDGDIDEGDINDDDEDGTVDEDPFDGEERLRPWSTIVVQVHETADGNKITGYVQGIGSYPRNTISWDYDGVPFTPVAWTNNPQPIVDGTLTSEGFDSEPYPEEIGLHVFYDAQPNNDLFFDDFAMKLVDSEGHFIVIQY